MLKMTKKNIRIVCFILITSIIMPLIPVTNVSANVISEKFSLLEEYVSDEVSAQSESVEEAIEDSTETKNAGDWKQAHYVDGLPWNYFHNAVQNKIREMYEEFERKEIKINLKSKKIGYADLSLLEDRVRFIWEVKPLSYKYPPKHAKGKAQLQGYIDGTSENAYCHKNGCEKMKFPTTTFEKDKYSIKFEDGGDGLIYYSFRLKEEPTPTPKVNSNVNIIQDSSSKDETKADIIQMVRPGAQDKGDDNIAAIVDQATIFLGVTSVVIAANKVSAKYVSSSRELEMSSVALGALLVGFLSNPTSASAAEIADVRQGIEDYKSILEAFYGMEYVDAFKEALENGDQEKIDEFIKMIQENSGEYEKAGKAQPPRDPLIIDFGEKGIELKSLEHGVNFDLDNNGFAEKTAWVGTEDGFLAFDRDENGKIDNGGELFGDQVVMKNGKKSSSGFEALKELDDNEDGIIDDEDTIFKKLLIWIDNNHNGISEANELKSLKEMEIENISLAYEEISLIDDETGTRIAETADVSIKKENDVETTQISEFWFPVNSSDTTQGSKVTAGNVPDILSAVKNDDSGELYDWYMNFVNLKDPITKRYYLKKILYKITNAENIDINSRGGNIDARDLKVVEQFMGREFIGVDGTSPNSNAAVILKDIYRDIENQYYNMLNIYTAFGAYLKTIYEYIDEKNNKRLNLSFLYYVLDSKINNNEDMETDMENVLFDLGVYLSTFDKINGTGYYEEFEKKYSVISEKYANAIMFSKLGNTYLGTDKIDTYNGTSNIDFIFGLEGSDTLLGSDGNDSIDGDYGDDMLSGGAGNDTLMGKAGNDTLDGGTGNDILKGGEDNDTYVFTKGYGKDKIIDLRGQNTLWMKGLRKKDICVNGINDSSAVIKILGTNDALTISNFCKYENYENYSLKFENEVMQVTDKDSPFHYIYGDEKDNVLKAVIENSYMYGYEGNDTIIGSGGNDYIYGNKGKDEIYADEGDDNVFAGIGDDLLDGGAGNDFLYGGEGEDTYVFGKGYGTDIIDDKIGESVIKIEREITLSDLEIYQVGEDAVICIKNTDDKLIISECLKKPNNYFIDIDNQKILLIGCIVDENNKFYLGSEANDYFENSNREVLAGGKGDDRIIGVDDSEYVFGDSGNDQILSANGNDVIFGGKGNDYINSGDGDDYNNAGEGNDFIDGGNGDDVYIFCLGYGNDSIMDSNGKNTIMFGDGINADSIKAYRSNWNDLLITFDGANDTLVLKNYCISEDSRDFNLIFADGTVIGATNKNSPLRVIYGTDDSEYMTSIYSDGVTKIGQDGNDQLIGSDEGDFLYGGRGDDRIIGNKGDDVLDGGEGNDYLAGGEGNDTYIFKAGYGKHSICDGKGKNAIDIYGHSQDEIKASRTNWNNITIAFKDSEDQIIIDGFFQSEADRNFYLTFNGGEKIHVTASNSPLRTIYGNENDEYILAMDDGGMTIFGEGGNDNLNGGNGVDKLYGNDGGDQLYGKGGNDSLDGGKGNDYLYGGAGKDTYVFNKGYGQDIIIDSEGINTISFGKGLESDQLTAYRTNWNDLTISFKNIEDTLTISGYFTSENNRKFNVNFTNGIKFSNEDPDNVIRYVHATEYDDWMNAWSNDGIILYGDKGNDHLFGGTGDDILSGEEGNDFLSGEEGDDIYIYGYGYENDVIEDLYGNNKLLFKKISNKDVEFNVTDNGNLIIKLNKTNEKLIINNFNSKSFVFEFDNGVIGRFNEKENEFIEE